MIIYVSFIILIEFSMSDFVWSKYQQDIFRYALDPDKGSFCIEAVAGSGKTTVLVEVAKRLASAYPDEPILFVAFNRSIAQKLKEETKDFPNMKCCTTHSFGLSVLKRSGLDFVVNDNKWYDFIKNYMKKLEAKENLSVRMKIRYISNCLRLFHFCRANNVRSNNLREIKRVADLCGIMPISSEPNTVKIMLEKSYSLYSFKIKNPGGKPKYEIDYSDMINLPLNEAFRRYIPKYSFVMCDEAQDLTMSQQELICAALKKHGKLIPIGDSKQSIYFFSTGKADTFSEFKKLCNNVCLPLSVSYRCGKNIIAEAQKINPNIQACDTAGDGAVIHQGHMRDVKPGDMVLCRKTNPLITLAMRYLRVEIPVKIKGKDIGDDLIELIDKVTEGDTYMKIHPNILKPKLEKYLDEVIEMLMRQGLSKDEIERHQTYQNVFEKVNAINIIAQDCETVYDIRGFIWKLFNTKKDEDMIVFSTVHKAKGLESDNVYILCPECLPMITQYSTNIDIEQEMNLKYVAVTRAKKRLTYVDVEESHINEIDII